MRSFHDRPDYTQLWVGLIVCFILFGLMTIAFPVLNEITNPLITP